MNVRQFLLLAASITALSLASTATAQDPFAVDEEPIERVRMFESLDAAATKSPSDMRRSRPSVSELRQARGLYKANQRMARIEYNLWIGHEPLRPRWNSVPMMTSRYPDRKVYVPIYIRTR